MHNFSHLSLTHSFRPSIGAMNLQSTSPTKVGDIPFTFHLNQLYASAVQHDGQQQEMVSRLPENLNFFPMCTPDWFPTAKQN